MERHFPFHPKQMSEIYHFVLNTCFNARMPTNSLQIYSFMRGRKDEYRQNWLVKMERPISDVPKSNWKEEKKREREFPLKGGVFLPENFPVAPDCSIFFPTQNIRNVTDEMATILYHHNRLQFLSSKQFFYPLPIWIEKEKKQRIFPACGSFNLCFLHFKLITLWYLSLGRVNESF